MADDTPLNYGLLDRVLSFRIRRANGLVQRSFVEALAPDGYVPKQYSAAFLIQENDGVNLRELARAMGLDPSTLLPTIDHLDREGWITRVRSRADRRVVTLHTTALGRRELKKAEALLAQHDALIAQALTAAERRNLLQALEKISAAAAALLEPERAPAKPQRTNKNERKK